MGTSAARFDASAWTSALEKFCAVTHLTVTVYNAAAEAVCGPVLPTALHALFAQHRYDPGLVDDCVQACLAQESDRSPIIPAPMFGLTVVGTALVLDGRPVGAAVAGYALVDFTQTSAIERLARQGGVPFRALWDIVRQQQPIPERRLLLNGELLQVLGDTILRETAQTLKQEQIARELEAASHAKDEFLAVLSHELRTPLTPILGWARILATATDLAPVAKAAEVIERNARFQMRLVDDLLELNRAAHGKLVLVFQVHCLNVVLDAARETILEAARNKQISVDIVEPSEPLCIDADLDRLQQIVGNVLTNAVKFTPAGGSVIATLSREEHWGVIRVRDNGEGVSAAFLPFLFDIFRQQEDGTRRTHGGLGIGLALVKRLTEAHKGEVYITSDGPGQGTTVTLRFPLVDPPADRLFTARRASTGRELDGLRVLVVEDMQDSRDATQAMLERLGAVVTTAADGITALSTASREPYDLVLCDLRMPRMDGYEFLTELHLDVERAHPPVVAISGLASSADHKRTAAAGFDGHIDKPFDDRDVVAAVAPLLARHRGAPTGASATRPHSQRAT